MSIHSLNLLVRIAAVTHLFVLVNEEGFVQVSAQH
jgi:hypothetical protein